MLSDLRLAFRQLIRAPEYFGVAVITLALSVGAATAVYSIVHGVLLRPLDHPGAEELVDVRVHLPSLPGYPVMPLNARFYLEWAACPAFAQLALIDRYTGDVTLTGVGEPERIRGLRVSANLFETLRVPAALGRVFRAGDDAAPENRVAVISDRIWRRRFDADPSVIGRVVTLNQEEFTIVGVLPAGFRMPITKTPGIGQKTTGETEVFLPKFLPEKERANIVGQFNYESIGRLASGATLAEADAQLNAVAAHLVQLSGEGVDVRSRLSPLHDAVVGPARLGLLVLLGAVSAVWTIACINLAVLGLVRSDRAARETAVRAALGATRIQLMRLSSMESCVIAASGGALAVVVAWGALRMLLGIAPPGLPRLAEVRMDGAVLAAGLLITVAAALISGLLPACVTVRRATGDWLRSGGRTSTGSISDARLRHSLIAAEVGVGTILLIVASLLAGSFVRVLRTDPGFAAPTVVTAELAIPAAKYNQPDKRLGFYTRVIERIQALPGVETVALANALPMQGQTWIDAIWTKDHPVPPAERMSTNVRFVSADYFAGMGIPLRAGRAFADNESQGNVAVISERIASALWPNDSALGRRLVHHGREDVEVVGVVGDLRADADGEPVAVVYRPLSVWPPVSAQLVVRMRGDSAALSGMIRAIIREIDADIPLPALRTMNDIRDAALAMRRFQLTLAGVFGVASMLLACLGIYAVVSYAVTRRTQELGIRAALGAQARTLVAMVLRQGLVPVIVGLTIGCAGSLVATRWLTNLLYQTSSTDPGAYALVVALFVTIALAACWLPARRATRIDPLEAMRRE